MIVSPLPPPPSPFPPSTSCWLSGLAPYDINAPMTMPLPCQCPTAGAPTTPPCQHARPACVQLPTHSCLCPNAGVPPPQCWRATAVHCRHCRRVAIVLSIANAVALLFPLCCYHRRRRVAIAVTRGSGIKIGKKRIAPNAILELYHVYIYYITSHVQFGNKIRSTALVMRLNVAYPC